MCTTQHRKAQGRSANPPLTASPSTVSLPTLKPPVSPGPKGRGRSSAGAGSLGGGLRGGAGARSLTAASPSTSPSPSVNTTPTITTTKTNNNNNYASHPSTARTVAPLAASEAAGATAAGDNLKEMEPLTGNTYYRLQSSGGGGSSSSSSNNNNNGTNTTNSSSSTNSSNSSLGSSGGPGGREFNIAVLGAKGVGKSAIVVRYLTRRFIGDYDSQMDAIFTHSTSVDNKQVIIHIMDTPWHCPSRRGETSGAEDPVSWADGFLLVFSLTDPGSWSAVQELVGGLRRARQDDRLPLAVAGNKSDLVYLRRLSGGECAAWCAEHGCAYRETSASEDPGSVEEVFLGLCRQVRTLSRKREKLLWVMQRPAVAAKLQIRQSLRQLAEKTWRSRTSTF